MKCASGRAPLYTGGMAKDNLRRKLQQLADERDFIPGIYNYCDRWCERCAFTARCMVYAQEQEFKRAAGETAGAGDSAGRADAADPAFWQGVAAHFEQVRDMIEEDCRDRGIDLTVTEDQAKAFAEAEERRDRELDADPLLNSALDYMTAAAEWFKGNGPLFEEKAKQLVSEAEMALPGSNPEAEAADLSDATRVINWYHMQIAVKIRRALDGLDREADHLAEANEDAKGEPGGAGKVSGIGETEEMDDADDLFGLDDQGEDEDGEEDGVDMARELADAARHDADGAAKVALIGIDNSLEAWKRLRSHLPEEADPLLDTLAHLDRLRRAIEARFPNARAFKRPGFDEQRADAGGGRSGDVGGEDVAG